MVIYWILIQLSYLIYVYKDGVWKKSLWAIINQGFIKFIPKVEDPQLIISWWAITLLNVSYKILAKAIALRIKYILP